jgi:hypothetical protein
MHRHKVCIQIYTYVSKKNSFICSKDLSCVFVKVSVDWPGIPLAPSFSIFSHHRISVCKNLAVGRHVIYIRTKGFRSTKYSIKSYQTPSEKLYRCVYRCGVHPTEKRARRFTRALHRYITRCTRIIERTKSATMCSDISA